jgi:hypothetical protein
MLIGFFWIFFELICLIILVINCVFQVSLENKVDLVIIDLPSNLPISHVSKPLSLIPLWNRRMDNFNKSIMFFANKFLSNKRVVIIKHANELQVLKEIHSLLESYQLKVCMK